MMQLYIWRHNRRFHSWSMMNEPCVHQSFYTDATIVVVAASVEEALETVSRGQEGWIVDELRRMQPRIVTMDTASVVFSNISGN